MLFGISVRSPGRDIIGNPGPQAIIASGSLAFQERDLLDLASTINLEGFQLMLCKGSFKRRRGATASEQDYNDSEAATCVI